MFDLLSRFFDVLRLEPKRTSKKAFERSLRTWTVEGKRSSVLLSFASPSPKLAGEDRERVVPAAGRPERLGAVALEPEGVLLGSAKRRRAYGYYDSAVGRAETDPSYPRTSGIDQAGSLALPGRL
jgi:hypothetical protein